jgi:prepilin-type N-terminal cleavage/methylation domain-containing protein
MISSRCRCQFRNGLTLVELLVVVAILLILVTASTAMMQSAADGREQREAARQLNAMIAGCVARAAELNRPVGVWFDRIPGNTNAAREVFYAQAPPVYAGDALNSVCDVTPGSGAVQFNIGGSPGGVLNLRGTDNTANTADDFVRMGDTIRFNYTGPWYSVSAVTSANALTIAVGDKPAPLAYTAAPFQIRRGPRKSLVNPLQLPGSTCVDFSRSGVGAVESQFAVGTQPVAIMFNGNGSIDRIYNDRTGVWVGEPVLDTTHLLVGDVTQIGPVNLEDMRNRWVSIAPSGSVITTENIGTTIDHNGDGQMNIVDARMFAIQGKTMTGN